MPSVILISQMLTRALDAVVTTLQDHLDAELAVVCADNLVTRSDFRLVVPEVYVRSTDDIVSVFRELNVDAVACWVGREGSSVQWQRFSSDEVQYNEIRNQTVRVSIVAKQYDGRVPVEWPALGRNLTEREWADLRAELYAAAITNAICKYVCDAEISGVWQVNIESTLAENSQVPDFGLTSIASVTFRLLQDVLIPTSIKEP